MVKVKDDLTGRVFGKLTVVSQTEDYITPRGEHYARWNCKCSCGNDDLIKVVGASLKRGLTTSCGCVKRERTSNANKRENKFDLDSEEYAIGYTRNGEPFWFDKEDYDKIKDCCWHYDHGYVVTIKNNKKVYLHRLVMGNPEYFVDHIKHPPRQEHKVDNRKSNLRIVTNQKNSMNSARRINNLSGRTGVCWDKQKGEWLARITINGKDIKLGWFTDKEDAINTRKEAEKQYFKEYSYNEGNMKGDNKNERPQEN